MILGIDPGATGALAWVSDDGDLIDIADMPMIEVRGKRRVCAQSLAALIDPTRCNGRPVRMAVVEAVGSMPKQGVSSTFAFGYGAGLIEGVLAACEVPVTFIRPATWKKRAQVPADKGAARQMASRLWPGAAQRFARVKDDGRAEAALLASWFAKTGNTQ